MKVTDLRINGIKNPVGFSYEMLKCSWKVKGTNSKKQKRAKIEVSICGNFESVL
jgi:alpha-L-rhamnosidase